MNMRTEDCHDELQLTFLKKDNYIEMCISVFCFTRLLKRLNAGLRAIRGTHRHGKAFKTKIFDTTGKS